eukprot:5151143-Pyramimonas_sp.AAC.1
MPGGGGARQCRAMPSSAVLWQATPGKARQCRAMPISAAHCKQCRATPSNGKHCQTHASNDENDRAMPWEAAWMF